MSERRVAPYGEWESPLDADALAEGAHLPAEAAYVDGVAWWSESVAAERLVALFRAGPDGSPERLLPGPWNVRSRVHEYGGGAWTAVPGGAVFVHFDDQRLRRIDVTGSDPVPLTPEDPTVRYGGLRSVGDRVLAIRETATGDGPTDVERDLVLVPLDGRAAGDAAAITSVVAGSRFLAHPAVSPDGRRLAWIAWNHPDMPWDASELRVGDLVDGRVPEWRTLLGGPGESVLQPEWLDDRTLAVLSDRTGWWNLYRLPLDTGGLEPLDPRARETGGPLWVLGQRWYLPTGDGRILATSTLGADEQVLLDPATGQRRRLRGERSRTEWWAVADGRALLIDEAASEPGGLRELDLATGEFRTIRGAIDGLPLDAFPAAEPMDFDGVHAVVYRPSNPRFRAPDDELPPFVAFVHGGPTAQAGVGLDPSVAFYTSRGIGVVDVDYGGSTGYGRAYRERLRGQWGVVDVEDVVTAVTGLGAAGIADPARLAIEGGSAGGWTVLAALTTTDVFACGVSYYGVADAVALATDTHDFESRYTDGLIGPYPEAAALYAERAPINHVATLTTPVLLLQGSDDRIVPPAQSQAFRDALAARGIPHAYLEFAGEGHGFRGKDAIVRAKEAALAFLGDILGFVPPGVPALDLD
ncbi:prolyl oligopeptidase family serine peptidase [Amnibacterium sp.]|uniref:S9 family peptidase n=1 Tax=Amnibacterium sp. TaxID=1872496 RepID=UPI0026038CF0|nr:prolyl oligopeptidase family serine peptidase [Amnibacterium sp.]MCU1471989.1 putative secreted prolyl oligopeptidase [Amnibacterium sp.]